MKFTLFVTFVIITWLVLIALVEGSKRLKCRIEKWIVGLVINQIAIGGHCGCCGKWVENCLLPHYWRVTVCEKCVGEGVGLKAFGCTCTKWEKEKVVNIASVEG